MTDEERVIRDTWAGVRGWDIKRMGRRTRRVAQRPLDEIQPYPDRGPVAYDGEADVVEFEAVPIRVLAQFGRHREGWAVFGTWKGTRVQVHGPAIAYPG